MTQRFHGKIKWFNKEKGFGFIIPELGGADVFMHQAALDAAKISEVSERQAIEYSIQPPRREGEKGKACDLKLL